MQRKEAFLFHFMIFFLLITIKICSMRQENKIVYVFRTKKELKIRQA